jgi:hypothetical protein
MFHESGTGNGMAKSVSNLSGEPCDAATATFAIIQGMYTIPSFQDLPTCVHHVWIFLNKQQVYSENHGEQFQMCKWNTSFCKQKCSVTAGLYLLHDLLLLLLLADRA